jgi:oligopeptide transport system substrate-binding protein
MKVTPTIALVLSTLTLTSLLTSCSKKEDTKYANYVHEAILVNVKGFDPVISNDLYSGIVMGQIFEGLMQYNYLERPTKVEPLLADGMPKVSKDGLTYTFKIKNGILFHDDPCFKTTNGKGRELVANDFIYSWKRTADTSTHSDMFWLFEDKVKGMSEWRAEAIKSGHADYSKPIEGISTPDDHTIIVKMARPYPQFLYVLTMMGATAVPHEAIETYGPEFQNHPVGTGPYRFKSWTRNSQIILDRNPNFHEEYYPTKGEDSDKANGLLTDAGKRLPLNDGVIFTETVESQPRWLNFRKGLYDWIDIPKDNFDGSVKNGELSDELKRQGVVLTKWVDPDLTFHSFNMDDPILGKNKYLRQAISLAVNAPEVIEKFYNGRAIPAQGPIPPTISGYDPKRIAPYRQFNIEKAKELLKKAGYPNGDGLPEIVYETYSGTGLRQMVEFFQQEQAKIGVKIKINMNTWPEFIDKTKTRKAQMFGMAWSADYPDAENFLQMFYGKNASPGPNGSNFNNPEYNKLYEQAAVMFDTPARSKIYNHMVDILNEECPDIFESHRKPYILTHGWFKNYKRNFIILNYVKYYRIDQQAKTELEKKL